MSIWVIVNVCYTERAEVVKLLIAGDRGPPLSSFEQRHVHLSSLSFRLQATPKPPTHLQSVVSNKGTLKVDGGVHYLEICLELSSCSLDQFSKSLLYWYD